MSAQVTSSSNGVSAAAVAAIPTEALSSLLKNYSGWLENVNKLQSEAFRFLGDRFNKDVEIFSKLSSCKKPEDFLGVQSEFMSSLLADYAEESTKLFGLFNQSVRSGLEESVRLTGAKRGS